MNREQAGKIAWKHFAGADCTRELQRAVNAIMEATAIERADEREACAKVVETTKWPSWAEGSDAREVFSTAIRARGNE